MKSSVKKILGWTAVAALALPMALSGGISISSGVPTAHAVSVDTDSPLGTNKIVNIAKATNPAVVNVRTKAKVKPASRGFSPGNPFERFLPPQQHRQQPAPERGGSGSGFIIGNEGYILTNHHVVDGADQVLVTLGQGHEEREVPAKLIGSDPKTDIALIQIESNATGTLPHLELGNSDKLEVGEWVVAIGNPFGLSHTVTTGIISAKGRSMGGPYDNFIQTDASINPGNSGGPLINMKGDVIGINTAIISQSGGNVGIGFAIPSAQVTEIVADLQANGSVKRGWLGVQIQGLNEEIAASLGLEGNKGALIVDVQADSPAEKGELKSGDVVLDFDGSDIETVRDLTRLVAKTQADDSVEIGVWRDGKRRELDVRIGALEPEPSQVANASQPSHGKLGLELSPLTPDARRQFRIPDEVEGALVVMVDPQGPAASKGVRPGDVISMVGQQPVATPKDVRKQLDSAIDAERDHVLMRIERNGGARFIAMKLA